MSDKSADIAHIMHQAKTGSSTTKERRKKEMKSDTCLFVPNIFPNNNGPLNCINSAGKQDLAQTKQVLVSEVMQINQFCATVVKAIRSLGEKWITLKKTPTANSPREDSTCEMLGETEHTTSEASAVIYLCILVCCMYA